MVGKISIMFVTFELLNQLIISVKCYCDPYNICFFVLMVGNIYGLGSNDNKKGMLQGLQHHYICI